MNPDDFMPPVVRCSRCGEVLIEAKPTRRKGVVCLKCLGMEQDEEAELVERSDFGE